MRLRRLNEEGLRQMNVFLDSLVGEVSLPRPVEALESSVTSEVVSPAIQIDPDQSFGRRFELAKYLFDKFRAADLREPERDKGLWAWLALLWFPQLCPMGKGGRLKPRERARWIPLVDHSRRYYRHLVLGPYSLYRLHADHPDRLQAALCDPPSIATSEVFRTLIEGAFVFSPTVLDVVNTVYYDRHRQRLKKGAAGKDIPGVVRRMGDFLTQIQLTYDLYTISHDALLELLPKEFDRFRRV